MDTTLIHNKLKEFESAKIKPSASTLISYFKNRIIDVERCISELEMDNAELIYILESKEKLIDILFKLLIITGNGEKLKLDFEDEYVIRAIDFLIEKKDRKRHRKILDIASFFAISDFEKANKELITYVTRGTAANKPTEVRS